MRKQPSLLAAAALVVALALPSSALAQSAGDEQYTDPFAGGDQGGESQAQEPAPAPEQPANPTEPAAPADGGNGAVEAAPDTAPSAEAAQDGSPILPRTGAPVVLLAAIGYALLLAGVAIRRKA